MRGQWDLFSLNGWVYTITKLFILAEHNYKDKNDQNMVLEIKKAPWTEVLFDF